MAYSALPTKAAGDTLDLSDYNAVKGNFEAGVPDVFTTKGDLAAGTAVNAASRVGVGDDDSYLVADSGETAGIAWQKMPACNVTYSGSAGLAQWVWTYFDFTSENFDTDTMHDNSTNPSRITIPTGGDGIYLINFNGSATCASAFGVDIRFVINGTTEIAYFSGTGAAGGNEYINLHAIWSLSATDYVQVQYYTINTGVSMNTLPKFSVAFLRRQ